MLHRAIIAVGLVTAIGGCLDNEPGDAGGPGDGSPRAGTHYTETRYPIVLIPGILGFDDIFGVVEYFPAIAEALAEDGADVYVVSSAKANTSEVRAALLLPQLEEIAAITGAERLNLVGHSQGAIDARILAAEYPELVASVTSIGGPHLGAPLADKMADGSLTPLPSFLFGAIAELMTLVSGGGPNDVDASMRALSTTGMAAFNQRYPAALPKVRCGSGDEVVDGIHYYSWGGIGNLTNPLDLLDTFWILSSLFSLEANDGLVPRCSSHLGQVIRDDYWHNHIDETNMLFGLIMPFAAKPPELLRQHANRLRNAGL